MSFFSKFKKQDDVDLRFIDETNVVYPHYPPVLAKEIKPLREYQIEKSGNYNFIQCPGMHDYSRLGYIIPAWSNFHIKANKAGTIALIGSIGEESKKRQSAFKQPMPMSVNIIDGLFNAEGGVPIAVSNFPGPWKLHGNGNVSALVLPAMFHSNFLDDLYVYPGVVDYTADGFTTVNFICSAKRPCEVKIKAGDPILHVIPFITNKTFNASYGRGDDQEQIDKTKYAKWYHDSNFYRKYYMIRKKFTLEKRVSKNNG